MRPHRLRLLFAAACFCLISLTVAADWSAPVNLSASAADVTDVTLAVDDAGRVHAVWSEGGSLYHRYQTDGSWSPASQVASGWEPRLLADHEAGLHLVYSARPELAQEVLYVPWQLPQGWGLPSNLSQSANDSGAPALAQRNNGDLAVVWSESATGGALIMVARSSDGALWSVGPLPQASGTSPQAAFGPDGALTVAWEDVFDLGFPLEIMAATYGTQGWSLPEDVSYTTMSQSQAPSLAASEQAVWLAWEETTTEGAAIHAAWLGAEGWSVGAVVAEAGDRHLPGLVFDDAGLGHLAWIDGLTIDHASLPTSATVWQPAPIIANSQSDLSGLALAAGEHLHTAWLAGQEGVNRDAWVSDWSAGAEERFSVLLPLVMR